MIAFLIPFLLIF